MNKQTVIAPSHILPPSPEKGPAQKPALKRQSGQFFRPCPANGEKRCRVPNDRAIVRSNQGLPLAAGPKGGLALIKRLTLASLIMLLPGACAPVKNTPSPHATTKDTRLFSSAQSADILLRQLPSALDLSPLTLRYGSGVPANANDFLTQAERADYILIGEQHTSARHHMAQATFIALLAQNNLSPAIGLEMVPAALQVKLDAFNARLVSVDELSEHLDWEHIWGFDFNAYKPIFQVAEYYNIPVYGLNVSQGVIKDIRKHGSPAGIAPLHKNELPPVIQYPTDTQYKKLSRFFTQHASMLMGKPNKTTEQHNASSRPGPTVAQATSKASFLLRSETQPHPPPQAQPPVKSQAKPQPKHGTQALRRFITIQSLWDSAMAYNASRTSHPGPLVILAGGAHVEYGYGIVHRLAHFAPTAQCLTVMPLTHPQKMGTGEADFYFVPKHP